MIVDELIKNFKDKNITVNKKGKIFLSKTVKKCIFPEIKRRRINVEEGNERICNV